MDTKRCLSCRKVLRADAHSCSRCGYVFLQAPVRGNGSATNGSRHSPAASFPSNPPASPHRAGHYSGLHPEDQPFQSSFMPVQRPPAITRRLVEQEPDEMLLPMVAASSADPQLAPLPEQPVLESSPKRYVASPSPLPIPMPQRHPGVQSLMPAPIPRLQFTKPLSPTEPELHQQITDPMAEQIYLPGKRQLRKHIVPILLLTSSVMFLLATSILAFLLLDRGPANKFFTSVSTTSTVQQSQLTSPKLQLPVSLMNFGAGVPGSISSKSIMLTNAGGGQIDWQAGSDSSWLTISPRNGTFSGSTNATLAVNRGNLLSQAYTGYITFYQNENNNTPVTLTVTMTVNPTVATVTASPPPATAGPSPVPGMVISTNVLTFNAIQGIDPKSQTFTITDTGNAPLNWAIAEDTKAAAFAPVSPTRGTVVPGNTVTIAVAPKIAQTAAGVINGLITISDTDTGTPVHSQQVTVKITISSQAVIGVSVPSLSFNHTSTITNSPQFLVITNTGSAPLNWTLSQPLPSWLSVDIPSGTLAPGTSTFINVTCDSSSLTVGNYSFTLVVSDTDAGTPVAPQNVQVTLIVT